MARYKNDAGQALVVVALAMVVILGFMGLGFDMGYLRYMKRRLQMVADAAALAGAAEISYCGGTSNCSALTTAAQDGLTENGFAGSTLVTNCGSGTGTLTITVNNPPCLLGTADPHQGDTKFVETIVTEKVPVFFARILGYTTVTVTARAEARLGSSANCLYLLNTTGTSLSLSGNTTISLTSCGMYVDSSSATAVSTQGTSDITASSVSIVGGYSSGGNSSISPTPVTGVATASDPLAYIPKPTYIPCASPTAQLVIGGSTVQTLSPGSYCGGISIGTSAVVTFSPGNYVVGGGISISGSATVTFGAGMYVLQGGGFSVAGGTTTGSGVTFFLTGTSTNALFNYGPVSVSSGANVQMSAPTSGTYVGIMFYEDSSAYGATSSSASSFTANSTSYFQGGLYFPTTPITYGGGASARYTIIVATVLTLSGHATLNSDYSSLQGGSPIRSNGTGGVLVE